MAQKDNGDVYLFSNVTMQFAAVQSISAATPRKFEFASINGCEITLLCALAMMFPAARIWR